MLPRLGFIVLSVVLLTQLVTDPHNVLHWRGAAPWPSVPRAGDSVVQPGSTHGPPLLVQHVLWRDDGVWLQCADANQSTLDSLYYAHGWSRTADA